MNVRELLDVLGAGDLGAEVWVGVPTPGGGLLWRPLECVEDRIEAGAGPGRLLLAGLARPGLSQSPLPGPGSPPAEPLRDVAGLAEGLKAMGGEP